MGMLLQLLVLLVRMRELLRRSRRRRRRLLDLRELQDWVVSILASPYAIFAVPSAELQE